MGVTCLFRREDAEGQLANNCQEALNLLLNLERRLMRNLRLREQYVAFMIEYLTLGHMEVMPNPELHQDGAYYLPHHAVFKHSNPEGKIRIVFNPKLQPELWFILIRWRLFRYAFTTDIIKMFRQIRVHPEDTQLQRILWRSDPTGEALVFRLLTIVYGTSSAL